MTSRKSVTNFITKLECNIWYISVKQKVNYTNRYAVIDPASLAMLLILFTSILSNLIYMIEKNTMGLTIQS
jgi:hypothetical protein